MLSLNFIPSVWCLTELLSGASIIVDRKIRTSYGNYRKSSIENNSGRFSVFLRSSKLEKILNSILSMVRE